MIGSLIWFSCCPVKTGLFRINWLSRQSTKGQCCLFSQNIVSYNSCLSEKATFRRMRSAIHARLDKLIGTNVNDFHVYFIWWFWKANDKISIRKQRNSWNKKTKTEQTKTSIICSTERTYFTFNMADANLQYSNILRILWLMFYTDMKLRDYTESIARSTLLIISFQERK